MERMIVPAVKFIAILVFVSLYCFILQSGFEVIDPCSSTPGYNFTTGFIMLLLFPLLLGLLLCLMYCKRPYTFAAYLKTVLLAFASLLLAGFFLAIEIRIIGSYFSNQFFLVEYGCYNDLQIKDNIVLILSIINIATVIGLMIKFVLGRKSIKRPS